MDVSQLESDKLGRTAGPGNRIEEQLIDPKTGTTDPYPYRPKSEAGGIGRREERQPGDRTFPL